MVNTLIAKQQWLNASRKRLGIPFMSCCTAGIMLAFLAGDERTWHWFIVPTFVCGLLMCHDAVRWFRGEYDLFDPKGIMGIFGWYYFFLAPLLFVYANRGLATVGSPPDWRIWVGYLSIINIISIILYQISHGVGFRLYHVERQTRWLARIERLTLLFLLFGSIALAGQLYYFYINGGITGIINQATEIRETGRMSFTGDGLYSMAGQSLSIIILIYLTLRRVQSSAEYASLMTVITLLVALGILQFLFVGLIGSRGATVYSLFWFTGIIHHFWRPFNKKILAVGLVFLMTFMYVYGFYKSQGTDVIERLAEGESFTQLEQSTDRTMIGLLIADFSRVNVQSYQIYRLQVATDYDLRWGKTYAMALTQPIPSWLWSARPIDSEKVVAGTDLVFGKGRYSPGNRFLNSSFVYGLAGEAMLNFGVLAAPLPYAIWGFLIGRYRSMLVAWDHLDVRYFLAPFFTSILFRGLFMDLDNIMAFVVGEGAFVILFVLLLSVCVKPRRG